MSFEEIRPLADAVLLEGYVLYPYRASAIKNRYRWAFGNLAPKHWSEAGGSESWWMQSEFLVEGEPSKVRLRGALRFLQLVQRQVLRREEDGSYHPTESLDCDGKLRVSFEEGELREVEIEAGLGEHVVPFSLPGGERVETLRQLDREFGQVRWRWWEVCGRARLRVESVREGLLRVSARIENVGPEAQGRRNSKMSREEALRHGCLSTHLLLAVEGGAFVSSQDPPDWAKQEADRCENVRAWPVLAGPEGRRDLLMAAPIILYDHPQIAPESPTDFFDATETDALLVLRTQGLTDEEKREIRATDPRTSTLLDRVENMDLEGMEKLHGAIREFSALDDRESRRREAWNRALPEPDSPPPELPQPGSRVRLLAPKRRTDAQDHLYVGCVATVRKLMQDVSGDHYLAVTLDDDPAVEMHLAQGRFLYYYPDEVEALT